MCAIFWINSIDHLIPATKRHHSRTARHTMEKFALNSMKSTLILPKSVHQTRTNWGKGDHGDENNGNRARDIKRYIK